MCLCHCRPCFWSACFLLAVDLVRVAVGQCLDMAGLSLGGRLYVRCLLVLPCDYRCTCHRRFAAVLKTAESKGGRSKLGAWVEWGPQAMTKSGSGAGSRGDGVPPIAVNKERMLKQMLG